MRRPNFFIAGAPKSGTTALATYLRDHPSAFLAKPKEPHYFAEDLPAIRQVTSLDDYLARFEGASSEHRVIGEASVWYLFSSVALRRIREFDPAAKIVILVRNPVDLAYSLHSQLLLTLDEELPDFEQAWNAAARRRRGQGIPRTCREPRLLQYGEACALGRQLAEALRIFPRDQVHTCVFDEMRSDPAAAHDGVRRFLGIGPAPLPDFAVVNANRRYRSRRLARVVERQPPLFSKRVFRLKLSSVRKTLRRLNTKVTPRPPLEARLRRRLEDHFRPEVRLLEELLDRDLSAWRKAA